MVAGAVLYVRGNVLRYVEGAWPTTLGPGDRRSLSVPAAFPPPENVPYSALLRVVWHADSRRVMRA